MQTPFFQHEGALSKGFGEHLLSKASATLKAKLATAKAQPHYPPAKQIRLSKDTLQATRKPRFPEHIPVCTKGYLKYMNGKNDSEK